MFTIVVDSEKSKIDVCGKVEAIDLLTLIGYFTWMLLDSALEDGCAKDVENRIIDEINIAKKLLIDRKKSESNENIA